LINASFVVLKSGTILPGYLAWKSREMRRQHRISGWDDRGEGEGWILGEVRI